MTILDFNSFPRYFSSLKIGEKGFFLLFLLNLLLLLFFGKEYTKFGITGPFHLHDILFAVILLLSFFFKAPLGLRAIMVLIAISLFYLAFSFIRYDPEIPWPLYMRQYMIFAYMAASYFIVRAIFNFKNGGAILLQSIVFIALLAFITQIFYSCFYYFSNNELPFFGRNYFSPIAVMGVIATGAYFLIRFKGIKRQLLFIGVLAISFTIGHDSAYLALIVIYAAFYFLQASKKIKAGILILSLLSLVLLLVFVPGFSDVNMSWRIIYWQNIFKTMIGNGTIFYGNGFGVPYLNEDTVEILNQLFIQIGDTVVFSSPLKVLIVPAHNSFITMIFHLGAVSILLLLYPLKALFFSKSIHGNAPQFFLTLALIGLSVWAFFNVILELPHSASYFWLTYFTLAFMIKDKSFNAENGTLPTDVMGKMKASFEKLKSYCEKENFKGWDPYDGLNSRVFQSIPFVSKNRFFRLAWIQFFKRSPINLRQITFVQKGYNAKGLGLFITGYCNLYKKDPQPAYLEKIKQLSEQVLKMKSEGYSGACWGYNFDWQARAFFQPKDTPTVVATTFIAESLLEAYKITNNSTYLDTAVSASLFVLKDLNRTYDENENFSFSYSPLDKTQVFNASLLGAKLLCLVYEFTKEDHLLQEAKKAVQYVCDFQHRNGSWAYGTLPYHQWVDNFHTGYNLECIYTYQKASGDTSFSENIEKGLNYYLTTFFTSEGISKYYNDSMYPVDIHAPAQLIVTLSKLEIFKEHRDLTNRVLNWTVNNMQSEEGYFYYQKKKMGSSKIPYIRWAQAWMFYAYSYYFLDSND